MSENTLRSLSGMPGTPASFAESALLMVDLQNTYTRDVLELDGVQPALQEAAALLDRARSVGVPVIHIQHDAGVGSPFDVTAEIGAIVREVAPRDDERVVVKNFPNAFTKTELHELLSASSRRDVVLAGFMTHMCISSTARGAFSLGYRPTVVATATATRALPGPDGLTVSAAALQGASLAAVADLFGLVVAATADLPD